MALAALPPEQFEPLATSNRLREAQGLSLRGVGAKTADADFTSISPSFERRGPKGIVRGPSPSVVVCNQMTLSDPSVKPKFTLFRF